MTVLGSSILAGASGQGGYNLSRSLRFRSSASAYLNRTPASAGNRKTWTWSAWVKRGAIADAVLFSVGTSSSSYFNLRLQDNGGVQEFSAVSENPSTDITLRTSQQFRDPSAWYHLVFVLDTTQATSSNRAKLYVNGSQVTAFSSATYPTQNADLLINNNQAHNIGRRASASDVYFDGYMTEVNFIDGQALTPSSFGETSTSTGVWIPKKYTGTYGTNGFYLPFTDVATTSGSNAGLGKDFSGNGNYFNTNNISVTSGSTYDSMKDVPTLTDTDTANYCVLNPLNLPKGGTLSNGNLLWTAPSAEGQAVGTMYASSGKFYWEMVLNTAGAGSAFGIASITTDINNINLTAGSYVYYTNGNKYNGGSGSAYGATFTNGDIIGVALDLDAGTLVFYKNNTSQGTAFTGLSGTFTALIYDGTSASTPTYTANFGQRPFAYTPPTGFKALNTFNLPTPTIGATASSQANKYFDVLTYTGNGSASQRTDISWSNMQPDMVWVKNRTSANNHVLHDDVRGVTEALQPNLTNATDGPVGFGSDGFGFNGVANQLRIFTNDGRYNTNGNAYVTWGWKGSGVAGVTNTAGSITSTVSANQTAGFSIVTYTGNGTNATVGHGLGASPSFIIVKKRSSSDPWVVYHQSLGVQFYTLLNATDASYNNLSNYWSSTSPSSTVFGLGPGYGGNNTNGSTYVAYCFAQVAGYSAFGSYTGNGSSDGPFVFCGFRPRWILFKKSSSADDWVIYDTARNTFNVASNNLFPNGSFAEDSNTTNRSADILSNGFKIRSSGTFLNGSGSTFIYAAFAESPFKYANAR